MDINTIIKEIYSEYYESERGGLYDFPEKEKWLNRKLQLFRRNNPELLGYIYDEKSDDWIKNEITCRCGDHKFGQYCRMPNNKDK